MNKFVQVVTTVDNKEIAEKIADAVLNERLAACVQISECLSRYHWQGKIERSSEYLCVMKSRQDLYPDLEKIIKSVHTYDVPEILATEVCAGDQNYLAWLDAELKKEING